MNGSPTDWSTPDDPDGSATTDRVAAYLRAAAGQVELRRHGVAEVRRHARRRSARRRRVGVGVAAAGILATPVIIVRTLGGDGPRMVQIPAALLDTAPDANVTAAKRVDSDLVWNVVRPDRSQSPTSATALSSGAVPSVMLSTVPGQTGDQWTPQLWQTADGETWTPIAVNPPLSLQVFAEGRIAMFAGSIYAVGTAPGATARTDAQPIVVTRSGDGGTSWTTTGVDLDTGAVARLEGVSRGNASISGLVANESRMAFMVTEAAWIDYVPLLVAAGIPGDAGIEAGPSGITATCGNRPSDVTTPEGFVPGSAGTVDTLPAAATTTVVLDGMTRDGQVVARCAGESVRTLTWAQLGISAEAAALMYAPRQHLFVLGDGDTFTEVALPVVNGNPYGTRLFAGPNQFYVSSSNTSGATLFESSDGTSWNELPPLPSTQDVTWVGELDGRPAVAVHIGNGTAIAILDDSGEWQVTEPSSIIDPAGSISTTSVVAGPSGLAFVGQTQPDRVVANGGVALHQDGYTLTIVNFGGDMTVTEDASGEIIGTVEGWLTVEGRVQRAGRDDGSYDVLDDDGQIVTTFSGQQIGESSYSGEAVAVSTTIEGPSGSSTTFPPPTTVGPASNPTSIASTTTAVDMPVDGTAPATTISDHAPNAGTWSVMHSTDGVSWSIESVAEIAGIAEADIFHVDRVQTAPDGRIIVTVRVRASVPGQPASNVVLVGTPRG